MNGTFSLVALSHLIPRSMGFIANYPASTFCPIVTEYQLAPRIYPEQEVADLTFAFTGFKFLCVSKDRADAVSGMEETPTPWCIEGMAVVHFSSRLFETGAFPEAITVDDATTLASILYKMFNQQFGAQSNFVAALDTFTLNQGKLQFTITMPITQEVWQQTYNIKSLELTAAMEYFKQHGGQMAVDAPAMPADLSHNRTLN